MELWDIYNENGIKTGETVERGEKIPNGGYFLIVDVWIINNKGDF